MCEKFYDVSVCLQMCLCVPVHVCSMRSLSRSIIFGWVVLVFFFKRECCVIFIINFE